MANNVSINVSINAGASQAGAQTFVSNVGAMNNALTAFNPQLAQINQQLIAMTNIIQNLNTHTRNAGNNFNAFLAANIAADAVRSLVDSLRELTVESTLYAARTQELGVALSAVAKASGENIEVIKQQEFAMKQLNITTQDARQTLTRFIQADLDLNKSGALARTAQDLAVIAGLSTSEEINKLVIAIQTLQSRNLRTAGVFFTVDEVLDKLAKTTHRARDSFSTFEKQQAVLNAVLEFGTRVTGTYEAAMETASKQIRSMERLIFEAQNAFGNLFIPVLEKTVFVLSEMFIWLEKHPKLFAVLSTAAASAGAAFVVLNTQLVRTSYNIGLGLIQGIQRLATTLLTLPQSLMASAVAMNGLGNAATQAGARVAVLQVALGRLLLVGAIVGIVSGLAVAFTDVADAQNEFIKVSNTAITQGIARVKSLEAQEEAVRSYGQTLKSIQDLQLAKALPEFTNFNALSKDLAEVNKQSVLTKNFLEGLTEESRTLEKQLSKIPEGLKNASKRDAIKVRIEDVDRSQEIQNKKLLEIEQRKLGIQKQIETSQQRVNQLTGDRQENAELVARAARLEEERTKAIKERTHAEKAVFEASKSELEAISRLRERELAALGRIGASLAHNLSLSKREQADLEKTIRASEKELTRLEKTGQTVGDRYMGSLLKSIRFTMPGLVLVLDQLLGEDFISGLEKRVRIIGTSIGTIIVKSFKETNPLTGIVIAFDEFFGESKEEQTKGLLKNLSEADAKLIEAKGSELEFARQTSEMANALGFSSKQFVEQLLQVKETDIRFKGLVDTIEAARKKYKELQDQQEAGRFSADSYNESLRKIFLSPLDPSPEDKAKRIFGGVDDLLQQFALVRTELDLQGKDSGTIAETILGDPKILELFGQMSVSAARDVEKLLEVFGGDRAKAFEAFFKNNSFESAEAEAAIRKLINTWLDWNNVRRQTARDARKVEKEEFDRLEENFAKVQERINSFLDPSLPSYKVRMELEGAERLLKELETIATLRFKLGIPIDIPIDREKIEETRRELEVLGKVFDEIREAQNAYAQARLRAGAPVVNAQVRAETQLLNLVRERRHEEQELAADIAVAINKRIQLETRAAEVQRIQAKAFLDVLNEEQSAREELIAEVTKAQINQGDFSFADQNAIIQQGLEVANDPVVSGLNDIESVIQKSADAIAKTQVDFSKALGESVLRGDRIHGELRNHTDVHTKNHDLLEKIESNTSGLKLGSMTGFGLNNVGGDASVAFGVSASDYGKKLVESTRLGMSNIGAEVRLGLSTMESEVGVLKKMIAARESGGKADGGYSQIVTTPSKTRGTQSALGRYGIMDFTLKDYDNKAVGREVSPQEFINNPQIQEVVASYIITEALQKYGNRIDVLSRWLTGKPYSQALKSGARDAFGTDISKYLQMGGGLEGRPETAFQFTQRARPEELPIGKGLNLFNLKETAEQLTEVDDTLSGANTQLAQTLKQLNLEVNRNNAFKFAADPDAQRAGASFVRETEDREKQVRQNRILLELREKNIARLQRLRAEETLITRAQELFAQKLTVTVDNVLALQFAEQDLNRLRTDGIAIAEQMQEAMLDRTRAEIDAQKEAIRVQEEANYRANPVNRAREINVLLQKEYTERIRSEQELDDRLAVIRHNIDSGYLTSIDNRRRIEKQAAAERLEEHANLTTRILELDDQIANYGENNALRYQVAWREAVLDVKDRHAEAVESILENQAKIADQSTLDSARVRAKVLEGIAQTEGVSESIGGLFNDTFKVYADDIDRWIDKTTESMGNLGKIFNGFFKSISQRFLGSIQNTLLDAIFPPTAEEVNAKQGIGLGGVDEAEAAFTELNQATLALGQVNLGTAEVTVQTATALNALTQSANIASSALVQIASIAAALGGGGTGSLINTSLGGGGAAGSGSLGSLAGSLLGGGAGLTNLISGSARTTGFGPLAGSLLGGGAGLQSLFSGAFSQPSIPTLSGGGIPTLSGGGGIKGILGSITGSGGPLGGLTSLFSKGGIAKFLGGIAPQLPFLGLGLGAGLGAPSRGGGILGALGGGILGLGALAGLGGAGFAAGGGAASLLSGIGGASFLGLGSASGLGGAFASLFGGVGTTLGGFASFAGPLALIGLPLLVGAYFFGRKKQRQRDEKTRDELKGDAFAQIDQILRNVRSDRMDGVEAIAQAEGVRDAYFQQVSQIKTASVRRSAENFRPYFDSRIEAIRREADLQLRRQEISERLVPEFALGGWVTKDQYIKVQPGERVLPLSQQHSLMRNGGVISGTNRGVDDTFMFAQAGTLIQSSWNLGRNTNVRPINSSGAGGAGKIEITIENVSIDSDGIVFDGLHASNNQQVIVGVVNQAVNDRRVRR